MPITNPAGGGGQSFHDDSPFSGLNGRPALDVWTKADLAAVWQHLHNGNAVFDFVMGFRDSVTNKPNYKRSRTKRVHRAISWSLSSLPGGKAPKCLLAFVPYSTNANRQSNWGAFDFDAHDGNIERARRLASAAWHALKDYNFATILESTGSGGWHVWAISHDLRPAKFWIRLFKGIAHDIDAEIKSSICEIFPPDSLSDGFGKGLRAPGSWNPATNTFSEIWWHNCDDLIKLLPAFDFKGRVFCIGKAADSSLSTFPKRKDTSLFSSFFEDSWKHVGGKTCHEINRPATRHEKLSHLVGCGFYQVVQSLALRLACAQFAQKSVETKADENEHLKDFASLWSGMQAQWDNGLLQSERKYYGELASEAEQAAFRIIRNFARKADNDGAIDFPIVRDNLADRIDITGQGAGSLIRKFIKLGIIAITADYRPNVSARRYRWLAGRGDSGPLESDGCR
jgi:hypothetical protein